MRPHSFFALLAPVTTFAASIHLPRDTSLSPGTDLPSGWEYAGCAVDQVRPRSLSSASIFSKTNTAAECIAFCSAKGYPIAGTEYSAECYCGAAKPSTAPEGECDMPCSGDSSQACGGPGRFSLYYNPSMPAPEVNPGVDNWVSYGCAADSQTARVLPNFQSVDGPMTVAKCVAACQDNKYEYGGVEYAQECWCGNSPAISQTNDPARCFMPCVGNFSEFCGGPDAINIYGAPSTTPPPTPGCQPLRAGGYGLLLNGGFEDGFTGWVPAFVRGTFGANPDNEHEFEGCYAAHVVPATDSSGDGPELSITQYLSSALTPGANYLFTGYQGRLPTTLDYPNPSITVSLGSKSLANIEACGGSKCEISGQGGAQYTEHVLPFTYTGNGTAGEALQFFITWPGQKTDGGWADLLFDGFNLKQVDS